MGLAIFLIVNTFILAIITVDGNSMEPTFNSGQKIIFSRLSKNQEDFKRKDIVFFRLKDGRTYVKRIIGVPGEFLEIKDGKLVINGKEFESDISDDFIFTYNSNKWYLKEGEYFVLGDNREKNDSKDSRIFGPIHIEEIQGRYINFLGR